MAEAFLNGADVIPAFEPMCGDECRTVWQPTRFVSPAFRPASVTARCTTDWCR